MGMPAPHMSTFIKVQVFWAMGGYDLSFLLSSDFDLLLRLNKCSGSISGMIYLFKQKTRGEAARW